MDIHLPTSSLPLFVNDLPSQDFLTLRLGQCYRLNCALSSHSYAEALNRSALELTVFEDRVFKEVTKLQ